MKLITEEEIGLFYQYFATVGEESDRLLGEEERRRPEDFVYLMFADLLESCQRIVGVDGKVAREEVDAINALFASAGYETGWLSLKLESSFLPGEASSDVLEEMARIQKVFCEHRRGRGEDPAVEKALDAIETFLYVWTTFLCEIIIADREFSEEEIDLLLEYLGTFCERVSKSFGRPFTISKRIREQLHRAVQVCYQG